MKAEGLNVGGGACVVLFVVLNSNKRGHSAGVTMSFAKVIIFCCLFVSVDPIVAVRVCWIDELCLYVLRQFHRLLFVSGHMVNVTTITVVPVLTEVCVCVMWCGVSVYLLLCV